LGAIYGLLLRHVLDGKISKPVKMKIYIHEKWDTNGFWWSIAASRLAAPLSVSRVYATRHECAVAAEKSAKGLKLEVAK
jgi:hypothetical protein